MTYEIKSTGFPPTFINQYISEQLKLFGILTGYEQMNPIFPSSPTSIEDVFKNYIGAPGVSDPILIQYERLAKLRTSPFYRKKREQTVYYLYCTNLSKMNDSTRIIMTSLDREDSAGQDVNSFCSKIATASLPFNVFFHNIRVYQSEENRELMNLISAKTIYVTKIIIEYDYHAKDINVTGPNGATLPLYD
jgi:hypothetical protein